MRQKTIIAKKSKSDFTETEEEDTLPVKPIRKVESAIIEMVATLTIRKSFSEAEIVLEDGGDGETDFEPTDAVFYALEEEIKQCLEDHAAIDADISIDNGYFQTHHIEYAEIKRRKKR